MEIPIRVRRVIYNPLLVRWRSNIVHIYNVFKSVFIDYNRDICFNLDVKKKMNKKAIAPLAIVGIIIAILLIINVVGIASLTSKLSNSPLLWVFFIIGILILLKMFKK